MLVVNVVAIDIIMQILHFQKFLSFSFHIFQVEYM